MKPVSKVRKTTYRKGRANMRYVRTVVTKPNGDREITVTPAWMTCSTLVVAFIGVCSMTLALVK